MAPFVRSCTASCQSSIVSIALACTIFEILGAEQYRVLEI